VKDTRYEAESLGGRERQFEIDRRVHVSQIETLALVGNDVESGIASQALSLQVTCPDPRILTVLDLQFAPLVPPDFPPDWSADPNKPLAHLSAATDLGAGPMPVEDLFGTAASPLVFVPPGLWGWSYSPTEEVEVLICDLVLAGAAIRRNSVGPQARWLARARWIALEPMGEIDWRQARGRMSLNPSKRSLSLW
jgi:hypothetical protein